MNEYHSEFSCPQMPYGTVYVYLGVEHLKSHILGRLFRKGNGLKIWHGLQHYSAYKGALKEL